jgi:coproporphyrinogen III oxidase
MGLFKDGTIIRKMEDLILAKQNQIIDVLESFEEIKFRRDKWDRPDGNGYGITCVIEKGKTFARGAVNVSVIKSVMPPAGVARMSANHASLQKAIEEKRSVPYSVCGLSLIVHPVNPMVPTVHLNYRYFETQDQEGNPEAWWFGGGSDLTPYYLIEEDAELFHKELKHACDEHSPEFYGKFKEWCDKYFYNSHRKEGRGIGGIFFDDLADRDPEKIYDYVVSCFQAFLNSYPVIVSRRKELPYEERHLHWQAIRHGRYVEFNLVHDRGTAFGLQTPNARIESILVSMPLTASWEYDYHPEPGSEEALLEEVLKTPKLWA